MFHKFNHIRKYLTTNELNELQAKIVSVEKMTSGEVRLILKHRINFGEKPKHPEDLAKKYFLKYEMHRTAERNGILLLVLFRERKIAILGGEGIHEKIPEGFWEKIIAGMTEQFSKGKFFDGILWGLDEAGKVLKEFFPHKDDDVNELDDDIIIK
ncbi:MAG TPA: TPM domain-containing protein [Ignavibacteria bacterium]|nr:TPM domain-containing protein [Ignavibacteria bacterium]